MPKDPFVFLRGLKFLENGVIVSLVDSSHRFAAFPALRATGTPYPSHEEGLQMRLVRRRDRKVMSPRDFFSLRPLLQ